MSSKNCVLTDHAQRGTQLLIDLLALEAFPCILLDGGSDNFAFERTENNHTEFD